MKVALDRRLFPGRFWARRRARYTAEYLHEIEQLRPQTDVFIVSFPKSGRTWHRMMLGTYLAALKGADLSHAPDVERLTADEDGRRVRYTHNSANFVDGLLPDDPLVGTPRLWEQKGVVFVLRDPKDVLVSAWFHARFRYRIFSGSLAEFIREPHLGVQKIATALDRWHANRHLAARSMVTSYESLSHDAGGVLRDTLEFLGVSPDPDLLARAVAASRFDRMRTLESSGSVAHDSLRTASSNPAARKVRSGKVGGYREHMTADDIAYVEDVLAGRPGYAALRSTIAHA